MDRKLLEHLAGLCGIESGYTDIRGERHRASDETLLALVNACGVCAEDDRSARAAAEGLENRRWLSILPPVLFSRESDRSIRVELNLPEELSGGAIEWVMTGEEGAGLSGTGTPEAVAGRAGREVNGGLVSRSFFDLPTNPGAGYHTLEIHAGIGRSESASRTKVIVTPETCHIPEIISGGGRIWGPAVQLYALRSNRNWGAGDLGDLRELSSVAASRGAGVIGLNPLHALYTDNPAHASPYCPSSRRFLNILYLDVEGIPDFRSCPEARAKVSSPEFRKRLSELRESEHVDYRGVAGVKLPVLEMLYGHFRDAHLRLDTTRAGRFRQYQAEQGDELIAWGVYESLREHFNREGEAPRGWMDWPPPYRNPGSPEVAQFAERNRERVEFFIYLQWQTEIQLREARQAARDKGMSAGIYMDLAVGVDASGLETWLNRDLFALRARIGSPPDDFNPNGQDWGLPPFIPHRLREAAYEPFISTLRENMRHADILRIDHVMGLMRLFLVVPGAPPSQGVYMRYRLHEMMAIVALESSRNNCMVIGEDLGTVPVEVREEMGRHGLLSYQLLYFSKEENGSFRRPADYPPQALASATTHDLPTLRGFWRGTDIAIRTELDLFPTEEFRELQISTRRKDRHLLLLALQQEGLLPEGIDNDPASFPEMTDMLVAAIYTYLARSKASVMMVQLEDILGQIDQVNLPGTLDQYPNWSLKLPLDLERFSTDPRFISLTESLSRERC